ncbi:MAG TPA: polyphenol oxidase family protein [Gemmatimonadales bacterium]|nr:polyphenol oxidase family protein [Gemmatimonadales bacterium]
MGKRRESGAAGQQGSQSTKSYQAQNPAQTHVTEISVPGKIPRFEIPAWRELYGVRAGITGRGAEPGRGFDLGLWSKEPVGEVMNRWLGLRRQMADFNAVVLGNQVHGVAVMQVDEADGWVQIEGIDGWVTTNPGILLTVTVADCVPIYLIVPGQGMALLHAGWRGTAGGILSRGVERLLAATSSDPSQVVMHCGVGICGTCYEVGSEVMIGCGMPAEGPGPWHLDLRDRLVEQARAVGLRSATTSSWCSAHHNSHFFSHRRSGGRDGRMVAYLGMEAEKRGSREVGKQEERHSD